MNAMQIAILIFTLIEITNVLTLYFNPGSKIGNGVGVFTAWEESKHDYNIHSLIKYLVNWVAGAKLIFILISLVVVFYGSYQVQLLTTLALIISILSFYWRLFPAIKKLDKEGHIDPKGYSIGLGRMITGFIIVFLIVTIISL